MADIADVVARLEELVRQLAPRRIRGKISVEHGSTAVPALAGILRNENVLRVALLLISSEASVGNIRVSLDGSAATTTRGIQLLPSGVLSIAGPYLTHNRIGVILEGAGAATIDFVEMTEVE